MTDDHSVSEARGNRVSSPGDPLTSEVVTEGRDDTLRPVFRDDSGRAVGWYIDPGRPHRHRRWDGHTWVADDRAGPAKPPPTLALPRQGSAEPATGLGFPNAEEYLVGTFRWETATDSVRWSPDIYRMHGYEPGEVDPCLALMLDHLHHADRPRAEAALDVGRASGHPVHVLARLDDARGRSRLVVLVATAVPHGRGASPVYVGHLVDVTAESARMGASGPSWTPEQATVHQAAGVLVALLQITPRTALLDLRRRASRRGVGVDRLAAELMRGSRSTDFAESDKGPAAVRRLLGWAARRA